MPPDAWVALACIAAALVLLALLTLTSGAFDDFIDTAGRNRMDRWSVRESGGADAPARRTTNQEEALMATNTVHIEPAQRRSRGGLWLSLARQAAKLAARVLDDPETRVAHVETLGVIAGLDDAIDRVNAGQAVAAMEREARVDQARDAELRERLEVLGEPLSPEEVERDAYAE